jgi:hypothetical protein
MEVFDILIGIYLLLLLLPFQGVSETDACKLPALHAGLMEYAPSAHFVRKCTCTLEVLHFAVGSCHLAVDCSLLLLPLQGVSETDACKLPALHAGLMEYAPPAHFVRKSICTLEAWHFAIGSWQLAVDCSLLLLPFQGVSETDACMLPALHAGLMEYAPSAHFVRKSICTLEAWHFAIGSWQLAVDCSLLLLPFQGVSETDACMLPALHAGLMEYAPSAHFVRKSICTLEAWHFAIGSCHLAVDCSLLLLPFQGVSETDACMLPALHAGLMEYAPSAHFVRKSICTLEAWHFAIGSCHLAVDCSLLLLPFQGVSETDACMLPALHAGLMEYAPSAHFVRKSICTLEAWHFAIGSCHLAVDCSLLLLPFQGVSETDACMLPALHAGLMEYAPPAHFVRKSICTLEAWHFAIGSCHLAVDCSLLLLPLQGVSETDACKLPALHAGLMEYAPSAHFVRKCTCTLEVWHFAIGSWQLTVDCSLLLLPLQGVSETDVCKMPALHAELMEYAPSAHFVRKSICTLEVWHFAIGSCHLAVGS